MEQMASLEIVFNREGLSRVRGEQTLLGQALKVQSVSNSFEIIHKLVCVGFHCSFLFLGREYITCQRTSKDLQPPTYFVATGKEAKGARPL